MITGKITIIGAGNMGGSIMAGLLDGGMCPPDITISDASQSQLEELQKEWPGISVCSDNTQACKGADIIILAVKPFVIKSVIEEIRGSLDYGKQTIVSIAAGIGLRDLEELFSDSRGTLPAIFHIIPNTRIMFQIGVDIIRSFFAADADIL